MNGFQILVAKLTGVYRAYERLEGDVAAANAEVRKLTEEKKDLALGKEYFEGRCVEREKNIKELEGEVDELRSRNSLLEAEKKDITALMDEQTTALKKEKQKLADLNRKLTVDLKNTRDLLDKENVERLETEQKNRSLAADLSRKMDELKELGSRASKLEESLSASNKHIKEMTADLEACKAERFRLRDELVALKETMPSEPEAAEQAQAEQGEVKKTRRRKK